MLSVGNDTDGMFTTEPTSNGDDVGILGLFLGKLNLNIMNVPQIGDDGSTSTDDLGMIFRINIDLDLETLQSLVGFLLLQLHKLLGESLLGSVNIGWDSTDTDDIGLSVLWRDSDVDVVSVHHLPHAVSFLSNDEPRNDKMLTVKTNNWGH